MVALPAVLVAVNCSTPPVLLLMVALPAGPRPLPAVLLFKNRTMPLVPRTALLLMVALPALTTMPAPLKSSGRGLANV